MVIGGAGAGEGEGENPCESKSRAGGFNHKHGSLGAGIVFKCNIISAFRALC